MWPKRPSSSLARIPDLTLGQVVSRATNSASRPSRRCFMTMNMKPWLVAVILLLSVSGALTQSGPEPIDWPKAKLLYQREQRGEKLSAEEQAFLDRAKAVRRQGESPANKAGSANGLQRPKPAVMKPLTDMSAEDLYEGENGGLYGGGQNTPPASLAQAARAALARIRPLDASGQPAADGRQVLVSISMSNATQEFSFFKTIADPDPRKSEHLTIVDCAQGGQAMAEWVPAEGRPWEEAMRRLKQAGVSPAQVQIAWVKLANKSPKGSKEDHLMKLEADTALVLQNARMRFPNLRIVYLSSRIWAGNATGALNPEPYAYETAFAVRNLILKQLKQINVPGGERTPVLLWGPYLWAEGEKGRALDDLKWTPEDFAEDGVHPSPQGRAKVANLLLEFFATNPLAKTWFAKPALP